MRERERERGKLNIVWKGVGYIYLFTCGPGRGGWVGLLLPLFTMDR